MGREERKRAGLQDSWLGSLYQDGEDWGGEGLRGKIRGLVVDVLSLVCLVDFQV